MKSQDLKKSILQYAMQGKLVAQDPSDEPASELLKRIKAEKEQLIKDGKIKKEKPLPPITQDEIPYDLPQGWEWVRLGELGITTTGTTPSTNRPEFFGGKYSFVKPADITNSGEIIYNSTTRGIEVNAYSATFVYRATQTAEKVKEDLTALVFYNNTIFIYKSALTTFTFTQDNVDALNASFDLIKEVEA